MNRHDRRAKAAQERRGDTMGKGYTVVAELPEHVRNNPHYKTGEAAAAAGGDFPPEYYAEIENAARLIEAWCAIQPFAELRWLEWDGQRTFIAAPLDIGAQYLADSPDARALLEWLDQQTGRRLSLNQAGWAIRKLGLMPMPDGSIWKGEPS